MRVAGIYVGFPLLLCHPNTAYTATVVSTLYPCSLHCPLLYPDARYPLPLYCALLYPCLASFFRVSASHCPQQWTRVILLHNTGSNVDYMKWGHHTFMSHIIGQSPSNRTIEIVKYSQMKIGGSPNGVSVARISYITYSITYLRVQYSNLYNK